jgi:hypothetical protein
MTAHVVYAYGVQACDGMPMKMHWRCSCGGGGQNYPGEKTRCAYCRWPVVIPEEPVDLTGRDDPPVKALLGALTHPRLFLSGDENGGISLHCRDHFQQGRPLAYYDHTGETYPDETVACVATIPGLWAEAVKHLQGAHGDGDGRSQG